MDDVQAAVIAASNVTNDPDQVGALATRYLTGIQNLRASVGAPAAAAAPTPQQAQANVQAQMGGTAIRDLSKPEERWKDALYNNPGDWFDNVGDEKASSGGGRGPDFRFKDESMEVKGLWLFSQYGPAPKWVFDVVAERYPQFNIQYPGTGGTPAPAAPAPAPTAPAAPQAAPVPF